MLPDIPPVNEYVRHKLTKPHSRTQRYRNLQLFYNEKQVEEKYERYK